MGATSKYNIDQLLLEYPSIGLEELAENFLMKRREMKFFFHRSKLAPIIEQFSSDYKVLSINDNRSSRYRSYYFDTEDYLLYHMHHNQRRNRYKFRFREYVDSDALFFEIKHKNNKMVTNKIRLEVNELSEELNENIAAFIETNSPIDPSILRPSIRVDYNRTTLIKHDKKARLTIDTNIQIQRKNEEKQLDQLAIIEFKYLEDVDKVEFCNLMALSGILPERISKYCIGVAKLIPEVKTNLFKQKLSKVDKIQLNGAIL